MSQAQLIAADAIAVIVLVFGMYFPRYRRKDMVVAVVGVNVGVLAVATVLSSATITAGLGLGLFGVLSIIRLRSAELDQEEVAYYFAALALGVLGGVSATPQWVNPVLMAVIVGALFIADHPMLFASTRQQTVTLDAAYPDEAALIVRLEALLNCKVFRINVKKIDFVNDTTVVDVRYRTLLSS
jgi:hypothetical protein